MTHSKLQPSLARLHRHVVRKPWGRSDVPYPVPDEDTGSEPIGEIWFDDRTNPDPDLLVKQLFTSERLSIQVHPDDEAARLRGFPRGKNEAWFILSAEPGASIALGPKQAVSADELRAAALDGGIEELMNWRPVQAGDFIYSPAGTIHAIGAGLTLIEVQQNLDLTYRLYDYGRPRDLHLDEGLAVASLQPFVDAGAPTQQNGRDILTSGSSFVIERWRGEYSGKLNVGPNQSVLLIPIAAGGRVEAAELDPGSVWKLTGPAALQLTETADLLIAYSGPAVDPDLRD